MEDCEAEQLRRFAGFCTQLDGSRTIQVIFENTVHAILQASQADSVTLYFSERGEALSLRFGQRADGTIIADENWLALNGLGRLVQESVKPVVISGFSPADRLKIGSFLTEQGVQALIALPILPETSTLVAGVLILRFQQPQNFSPADLQLWMLYASHVSRAITHVYLLDEFRQRDVDLHTVVDTVHMMISTLEMDELLRQVAVRLAWVSGMEDCAIAMYEADPDRVRILAHYNVLDVSKMDDVGQEYALSSHPRMAAVLWEQQPVFVRVDDSDIDPQQAAMMQQWGYAVLLMLPLKVAGQPIGFIELYSHSPDTTVSKMDMRRLQLLSEQVALALVNARLYQSECEQRSLADALQKISLALSSSLQAPAILDVLLNQLSNVVPYDTGCVMLVEGEQVRVAVQHGFENWGHPLPSDLTVRLEDVHNLHTMAANRRPMVISDVALYKDWVNLGAPHIRSWVGAPLIVRDRLLGFLSLEKAERNFYGPEHADRLGMLAGHAAIALWNALAFGEVEQASITDFLTGAYNHRHFQQQVRTEMDHAHQFHQPLSLLMVDLDHFKQVNDRYGHVCGDKVLNRVATLLRTELRAEDFLARYGGEEFAILLPGTSSRSLTAIGNRLLQVINSQPILIDSANINLTISIGGASYPEHAADVGQLIALADQSLYRAKNTGRNRFCMAGEG
jgi:diguanylate cyclase (GGDEF)-like protein